MRPEAIAETVPAEIEAGAGTGLEQAQRRAASGSHLEEAVEEDSRPTDLVGLGRSVKDAPNLVPIRSKGPVQRRPQANAGLPAGGEKLRCQGRCQAGQSRIVNRP